MIGGIGGCNTTGDGTLTDPSTSDSQTASDQTPQPDCDHATVTSATVEPEGTTASGRTVTLFEDYVVVQGSITGPRPPTVLVVIETVTEMTRQRRRLDGDDDQFVFRFGPFPHNGVKDVQVWLEGCDTPTAEG